MDFKEARKRNVIIKMTKCLIKNNKLLDKELSEDDIKDNYYFKERDIKELLDDIFIKDGNKYKIKDKYIKNIELYIKEYENFKNEKNKLITLFSEKYSILKGCFNGVKFDRETFQREITSTIEIAKKLHWILMPIYSEQMIMNRNIIPEDDLSEYYNHFHSIEDLYFESINKGIDYRSIEGDNNLNQEIKINIYTSRWGHYDTYIIKRTVDGWNLNFSMYSGDFSKNGEGKFFDSLNHDSVFFPEEAVKYALELLWDEADSTNMNIEELGYKLSQIAEWISEVEKVSRQYQPDWCNYF